MIVDVFDNEFDVLYLLMYLYRMNSSQVLTVVQKSDVHAEVRQLEEYVVVRLLKFSRTRHRYCLQAIQPLGRRKPTG
jgi:hypothetical protein